MSSGGCEQTRKVLSVAVSAWSPLLLTADDLPHQTRLRPASAVFVTALQLSEPCGSVRTP